MKFDDFTLDRAVIEVRFPMALLLWDRAGQLWHEVQQKYPTIVNTEANPAKTVFRLNAEVTYELVCESHSARIIAYSPPGNLKNFSVVARDFFGVVVAKLDILEFTRIGFRTIHSLNTKTRKEANDLVCNLALFRKPTGKLFGFQPDTISPEIVLGLTTDEVGTNVRIASRTVSVELEPPPGIPVNAINQQEYQVLYDIDYHTLLRTEVSKVGFIEWIPSAYRLIKKSSDSFLRELENE